MSNATGNETFKPVRIKLRDGTVKYALRRYKFFGLIPCDEYLSSNYDYIWHGERIQHGYFNDLKSLEERLRIFNSPSMEITPIDLNVEKLDKVIDPD